MPAIHLHPINELGQAPLELHGGLSDAALKVCSDIQDLYAASAYAPPWIGYLACDDGHVVGTCAFNTAFYKNPDIHGKAEIAYFTFPQFERRGYATKMASELIEIARRAKPGIVLVAHTLPEKNASTRVLEKSGFALQGPIRHPEDGDVWQWQLAD